MKVLHTGDWHVGRTLNRVSRLEETRQTLQEISHIAESEQIDAMVVCGDVFEHLSPSAEAEQVVYEALERFCVDGIQVVLLTGNHDHPARWHALAPLLQRFNVHVVDNLRRADDGGIVELASRDGKETLQVAAVPWISERRLYETVDMMGSGEKTFQSYAEGMSKAVHTLCEGFDPEKCNLLAGHLFISGTQPSGSERTLVMGDIYAVTASAFPTEAQYVALGHVHMPQKPPGVAIPCRYAGSLLQLDFGEVGQQKSVVVVELKPGIPAIVREVPLRSGRKLKDVKGTLDQLRQYPGQEDEAYLRVTVVCDAPQPGLSDEVREILPNALVIKLEYPDLPAGDALDVRSKSPRELFEAYLAARNASEPDPKLLNLFDTLLTMVSAS